MSLICFLTLWWFLLSKRWYIFSAQQVIGKTHFIKVFEKNSFLMPVAIFKESLPLYVCSCVLVHKVYTNYIYIHILCVCLCMWFFICNIYICVLVYMHKSSVWSIVSIYPLCAGQQSIVEEHHWIIFVHLLGGIVYGLYGTPGRILHWKPLCALCQL